MVMAGWMTGPDNENNDLKKASRCFPIWILNKGLLNRHDQCFNIKAAYNQIHSGYLSLTRMGRDGQRLFCLLVSIPSIDGSIKNKKQIKISIKIKTGHREVHTRTFQVPRSPQSQGILICIHRRLKRNMRAGLLWGFPGCLGRYWCWQFIVHCL